MANKSLCVALFCSGLLLFAPLMKAETTEPKKKKMTLTDLLKASQGSSRHSTAVAGVRGLDETGTLDTLTRDYQAVDRLDQVEISDAELKQFVFEGLLK